MEFTEDDIKRRAADFLPLLEDFKAAHEANGSLVVPYMKRGRKQRNYFEHLEGLGIVLPLDLCALYYLFDGPDLPNKVSQWQGCLFLDFAWVPIRGIWLMANSIKGQNKSLGPNLVGFSHSQDTKWCPLRMYFHTELPTHPSQLKFGAYFQLSVPEEEREYLTAFDNVEGMLKACTQALRKGLIEYGVDYVRYDPKEFWSIAQEFNPNSDYWPKLLEGELDWAERAETWYADYQRSKAEY
ncbi:hypothetical protein [Aliiroseovarius crassostreae]|uniref:hypothetical protein n=1 Tax=Aliiroseovarius crassostreae TaxID=154981 RepID=UPI0022026381|nr:hypothetical protein [Aliiroseovarius crassostreae]UWQ06670.1 hypothetical protein K3X22_15380 [Aliiroseovarius crassostreae]